MGTEMRAALKQIFLSETNRAGNLDALPASIRFAFHDAAHTTDDTYKMSCIRFFQEELKQLDPCPAHDGHSHAIAFRQEVHDQLRTLGFEVSTADLIQLIAALAVDFLQKILILQKVCTTKCFMAEKI